MRFSVQIFPAKRKEERMLDSAGITRVKITARKSEQIRKQFEVGGDHEPSQITITLVVWTSTKVMVYEDNGMKITWKMKVARA